MPESGFNKAEGLFNNVNENETLAQMFSYEFSEIFKDTPLTEHLRATASCHG